MDYEFTTTFWQDFSIADSFGMEAILEEDKDDYEKDYDEKLKMIIEALEREEMASIRFDIVYWAWW